MGLSDQAGWVLTGGQSTRMGRDKAMLPWSGRTMIEVIADTVREAAGSVTLVGAPEFPLPMSAFRLLFNRRRLAGSIIGGIRETQEMLDFCAEHGITADVEVVSPDDTLHTAAKLMADLDAGVLPVGENDRLVGMITDRDIAVRGVAKGRDPEKTTVRDTMSGEVRYCFDDENPEEVARRQRGSEAEDA